MAPKRYKLEEREEVRQSTFLHMDVGLSEYSYANLFLFSQKHQYTILEEPEGIFLEGLSYDKKRYLMPLLPLDLPENREYLDRFTLLAKEYDFLFPIPEKWLHLFDETLWEREALEDDADYIYTREKLATYSGRKYHKKRNLVKQHKELYQVHSRPLGEDDISLCVDVIERWAKAYHLATGSHDADIDPCLLALNCFNELGLTGCLTIADGEVSGFALGERLSRETYVIHFAKADINYKGSYQYLFQELSSQYVDDEVLFMNMEQDLGLPGLRQTKHSYYPIEMGMKYRIRSKSE